MFEQIPLNDRLATVAKDARARANTTPPGAKQDALLKTAQLSENALQIQQWLNSPGLRAPT